MVEVDTDYDVPEELDEVVVHVSAQGADAGVQTARGALRRQSDVPISVVLEPADGVTTVRVLAEGYLDGKLVRQQSRKTSFVTDRILELPLFLAKACDLSCPDGETCVSSEQGARCEPEVIDLDPDDGGDVNDASSNDDASMDGGLDGGGDAGDAGCLAEEICNDEDDDCDGRTDEDGATICSRELPFANAICASDDEAGAKCKIVSCLDGYLQCDGDVGCETRVSKTDCGACGRACDDNQTCRKEAGDTEFDCSTDGCKDDAPDLCEGTCTDLSSSLRNCGACTIEGEESHECTVPVDHAAPSCEDGTCALNCVGSFRSCDDETPSGPNTPEYLNGCEVDTNTSTEHCGRCDNPCTTDVLNMEAYCDQGSCKTRCAGVYLDCDDEPGCETKGDTADDCFACGKECGVLTPVCCADTKRCVLTCL